MLRRPPRNQRQSGCPVRLEIQTDQGAGRVHRAARLVSDSTQATLARLGITIISDQRGCRAYLASGKLFQALPRSRLWPKLYARWKHAP